MSEPLDPSATPLAATDPDSITALFDADPALSSDASIDRLIAELRRRADVAAAEAAALAAAPKGTRKKRDMGGLIDAALAAVIDKPVSELSIDDLFGPEGD